MSIPGFSPFPEIPQRSTPEADFDAKMYALFQHFATTHRNELLAFIEFLENNSTVIDAALNGTTIGLTDPAAAKFTTLEADSIAGAAVQANATDASDGKLLTVGAGGILATNPPNLADPAQLDAPAGLYSIAASDGWPFDGALLQLRRNAGRGVQIAARGSSSAPNASSEVLLRTSGNSFGGWAQLVHTENLLGTVSESGGTPTGAVIERGSNANGEYVRFADGTQICISPDFTNLDVTETTGALYRTAAPISWTPPAGFGGAISMSGAVLSQGNSRTHWGTLRVLNSNSIDISVFAPTPATDRAVRAMVIGRWF
ncbi:hypothetical protein [Epibacterium sp. Ofav1-8]|uniref:hypothetical protein n=1 Tax=Epibacterium sp. Ofav1-8 TaxID=2917735 RepID=UPI001EF43B0E|nr:hypothetical protein [Epibacterium sp. Ofav1-8]MCG7625689.1 hypothetical protein [Epibacterium sp. Ofav1-8]